MSISSTRRNFLKSSLVAPAALAVGVPGLALSAESESPTSTRTLPRRKLGKNGPEVTILNIGGMMEAHSPRFLDIAWSLGIRYFDTADCYRGGQSEPDIGKWIAQYPERRKDLFLVTKDHPRNGPEQLLEQIDRRLEKCGTDYIDLFFIHGIGPKGYGQESLEWPKGGSFQKVCEKLKESGKAKMVGFSCHDGQLIDYLNAAADGGFVDAIMLAYNAFFNKGDELDRALDRCYEAGIGLVSMKEMRQTKNVPRKIPAFEELGLNTHQAVLHAVWSDPRISSICSAMKNVEQLEENTLAAANFKKPLDLAHMQELKQVLVQNSHGFCPGCAACRSAIAGAGLAIFDIARYVSYYEFDGDVEARELYRQLNPEEKDPSGVDLAAMRDACEFHVDYPGLISRAEQYFA